MTTTVKNKDCWICMSKKVQTADLSGGTRYITRPGIVEEFALDSQLTPGWTLGLYFHGRKTQSEVVNVVVQLKGVSYGSSPSYLTIDYVEEPEQFREDPHWKTILGVTPERFDMNVPWGDITRNIVTNNFLVLGDKDGKCPRTPSWLPLAHIWANFVSYE